MEQLKVAERINRKIASADLKILHYENFVSFFFNKSRAYFMGINNAKKRLLSQEGFQPGKPELHADILLTVNLRFRYEFSSTFTRISCRGAVSLEFHFSGGFPL